MEPKPQPVFQSIDEARAYYDPDTDDRFKILDQLANFDVERLRENQPGADAEYFGHLTQALELARVEPAVIEYVLTTSFPLFAAMHRNHPRVSYMGMAQGLAERLIGHPDDALAFAMSETEAAVAFVQQREAIAQKAFDIYAEVLQDQSPLGIFKAIGAVGSLVRGDAYLYSDLDSFCFTDIDLTSEDNRKRAFHASLGLADEATRRIREIWPQFGGVDPKDAPLEEDAGKAAVGESLWDEAHRQKTFAYRIIGLDTNSAQRADRILGSFKP